LPTPRCQWLPGTDPARTVEEDGAGEVGRVNLPPLKRNRRRMAAEMPSTARPCTELLAVPRSVFIPPMKALESQISFSTTSLAPFGRDPSVLACQLPTVLIHAPPRPTVSGARGRRVDQCADHSDSRGVSLVPFHRMVR